MDITSAIYIFLLHLDRNCLGTELSQDANVSGRNSRGTQKSLDAAVAGHKSPDANVGPQVSGRNCLRRKCRDASVAGRNGRRFIPSSEHSYLMT